MASSKSVTADKRRTIGKEKEYRDSSRSRASGHSRDVSKSRNEKTLKTEKPRTQEKHPSSSRDKPMPKQNARTASKSRESATVLEEKSSRSVKKTTEIIPIKDPIANSKTKLLESKLKSRNVGSTISSSRDTKESHSKSRSTSRSIHVENAQSSDSALRGRGSVKDTPKNKSGKLESNELSKNSKILTNRYPTFDIEKEEQSNADDDYPDDFENYDSDFEDSSGEDEEIEEKNYEEITEQNIVHLPVATYQSEVLPPAAPQLKVTDISETSVSQLAKPISKSINDKKTTENQWSNQGNANIIEKQHNQQIVEEEKPALNKQTTQSYINFNTAKQNLQTQKLISKIKKRGDVLLDLITLDETSINLFSLSPTAYDEFMIVFGGTNTKQAYTQTGDDNVSEESQTDCIEMLDLWTQYPPHIGGAIGGEFISKINQPVEVAGVNDWKHLSSFLNLASRVICSILEEEQLESSANINKGIKSKYDFSARVTYMDPKNLLRSKGICRASGITCSKLQPHILLSICEKQAMKDGDSCCSQMLICMWNIFQPTSPQKLLMCRYAIPLSCCLDDQANFAFAGMDDASVALWDLREPDNLHIRKEFDKTQWISLRTPTYSTAGINAAESHNSSVIAMRCQQDNSNSNNLSSNPLAGNKNSQSIIQLATLDEEAQIFIWVVTELAQPVIDWEHGLSPNGHVKLTKSLVINLQNLPIAKMPIFRQQHLKTHPRALDFITDPNNSSVFYVATDMGIIISCSLYGGKYKVYGHAQGAGSKAMSVAFLPMGKPPCFLAGYYDGSIVLFNTKKENALMVWKTDDSAEVVKIQWSKSSPNIFYALHGDGKLCIWDLKRNNRKPVTSISRKSKRITSFDVGNDKRVQNSSAANYKPLIVLGYDDGTVEAHYLTSQYSITGSEEMEFFINYIEFL